MTFKVASNPFHPFYDFVILWLLTDRFNSYILFFYTDHSAWGVKEVRARFVHLIPHLFALQPRISPPLVFPVLLCYLKRPSIPRRSQMSLLVCNPVLLLVFHSSPEFTALSWYPWPLVILLPCSIKTLSHKVLNWHVQLGAWEIQCTSAYMNIYIHCLYSQSETPCWVWQTVSPLENYAHLSQKPQIAERSSFTFN